MNDWFLCDFRFYNLPAFRLNHFNTMFCKFEVVFVFSIHKSEIFFESPVSTSSQFDQFASDMNLVMLDDKFEVNFWEFEGPLSFYSFQEEFDGCMPDDMS